MPNHSPEHFAQNLAPLFGNFSKSEKLSEIKPPLTLPWYKSSVVFWGVYLWTPNFLIFSLIISTCPSKMFFSNFLLLWENWPQMTKTKKFLVSKNEKTFFFFHFLEKGLQYYFKIEWRFFRGFFWGIPHFCRYKNKDLPKMQNICMVKTLISLHFVCLAVNKITRFYVVHHCTY